MYQKTMEKYFTPDIEDIRVGYECEIHEKSCNLDVEDIKYCLYNLHNLRVPYLSKEQIEKEGWKKDEFWKSENKYEKDINNTSYYSLTLNDDNQIVITKSSVDGGYWVWHPFFSGQCKDINTFRYICKLLNI